MAEFDSPEVQNLVERARTPLDAGPLIDEVATALDEWDISQRDRGELLLAQLVMLQGSISAQALADQAAQALKVISRHGDTDTHLTALAMSASVFAAQGNKSECLERCLDLSALIRANPDAVVSYRSSANFGAALASLGAYALAAPRFAHAIHASLVDTNLTGVVISCANLAMTVSRLALVNGRSTVDDPSERAHLDTVDAALFRVRELEPEHEMAALTTAALSQSAQLTGDWDAAVERWGDLDALTAHQADSFSQYLCLVEAPLAVRNGSLDRAHVLIDRALSSRHIVPLERAEALRIRSLAHEASGDLAAALVDARATTALALSETNGLADLLISQVDTRTALEYNQRTLLNQATHLTEQAMIDELSGIGNRRAYQALVDSVAAGPEHRLVVLLCDIDCFKQINDRFGHGFGDTVIRRAAAIVDEACGEHGAVFRYGGDEFVALPGCLSLDDATEMAQAIRHAFTVEPWAVDGQDLTISCSIGVWLGFSSQIEQGVAEADRQMYAAKLSGRDAVRVAQPPQRAASAPDT